jgi:hypothetical protein
MKLEINDFPVFCQSAQVIARYDGFRWSPELGRNVSESLEVGVMRGLSQGEGGSVCAYECACAADNESEEGVGVSVAVVLCLLCRGCFLLSVRYPFALRAERNGTNASDVRYPDAADPLYLLYLWTLGRRFLHSHLSPAYPLLDSCYDLLTA